MPTTPLELSDAFADPRGAFVREARERAAEADAGGPLYVLEDVAAYLRGRQPGTVVERPMSITRASTRG